MRKTDLQDIGIIACPGGIHFADEVITNIRSIAAKKVNSQLAGLSKKYKIPEADLLKKFSLNRDLFTIKDASPQQNGGRLIPDFRVKTSFTRFANGEFKTAMETSIRGKDVYIIQDLANQYPIIINKTSESHILSVNDHLMCLFTTVDAALQAGAARVTVVLPTYPYSRQHKKKGREGLTAARMGQIMEYMGVSRIITLDIHSREIENSFNRLRLENLHASYQILRALSEVCDLEDENLTIVSPDTGSVERNKFYALSLNKPLAMLYKERDYSKITASALDNNITKVYLLGDVKGKNVFMSDDILGSGGTLMKAMENLKSWGAEKIICAISLPFFNGEAVEIFDQAYQKGLFYKIIGTNAVYHEARLLEREWYISANVSRLFAKTIFRLSFNLSLSTLLDNRDVINRLIKDKKRQK
ncbi:MAG: ribose-phosphate diphosphokinase [Spirochaetaceae bacterium]|nr:MAG: ribose-phosphate diphosphokinase [Spirochaetaceae bacterium]